MMMELTLALVVFLLVLLLAGMVRILRGPSKADRMMAAQLFGTQATAILLLIGVAYDEPATVDVALVLALLAVVASVAFIRTAGDRELRDDID